MFKRKKNHLNIIHFLMADFRSAKPTRANYFKKIMLLLNLLYLEQISKDKVYKILQLNTVILYFVIQIISKMKVKNNKE